MSIVVKHHTVVGVQVVNKEAEIFEIKHHMVQLLKLFNCFVLTLAVIKITVVQNTISELSVLLKPCPYPGFHRKYVSSVIR